MHTWHRRFGQLGYGNLAKLVASGMVTGMNVPASAFNEANATVCKPRVMAKHHWEPFPQSSPEGVAP